MFRNNSDCGIYQLNLAVQGSLKTGNIRITQCSELKGPSGVNLSEWPM